MFSDDRKCRRENLDRLIDGMYDEVEGKRDGLIIIGRCNKEALKKLNKKYKSVVSVNTDIYHTLERMQFLSWISLSITRRSSAKNGSVVEESVLVIRILMYQVFSCFAETPFFRFRAASLGT